MQSATSDEEKKIINRTAEMAIVRDALKDLLEKKPFLKTPIVDFFGVEGIGKTRILQEIVDMCRMQELPCIELDTYQDVTTFAPAILEQVARFTRTKQRKSKRREGDSYSQALGAIKTLLKNKPAVILLDSIDTKKQDTFGWIKTLLYELIKNDNLFIVLASRQKLIFEQDGSMARNLTPFPLKSLNYDDSQLYLNSLHCDISAETKNIIFQWTRGYPLAISVIVRALQDGQFDIESSAEDQRNIVSLLIREVIDQKVLGRVEPDLLDWYKAHLSLLSMPRRFNLVIMQKLLEKFERGLIVSTQTILEYIGLPNKLNTNTDILHWDLQRTGFAIDDSVRTLFLLQRRMKDPVLFVAVHRFLAKQNQQLISEVPSADSIRYLREYLYHQMLGYEGADIETFLREGLQQIPQKTQPDFYDALTQFKEEFDQDEEFKEILGQGVTIVSTIIDEHLKSF